MPSVSTDVEDYSPRRLAGTDLALPARFSITADDDERETSVRLGVVVTDAGRVTVRSVSVSGDDVAMADLRAVKLPRLVEDGMRAVAMRVLQETPGGLVVQPASDEDPVDLAALFALALEPEPEPASGRQPVTPERLRRVAKLYRAATSGTFPGAGGPTAMVATSLGLSRSQAAALVGRARHEDDPETGERYLGKASRGKAGER